MNSKEKQYLRVEEAARILGIDRHTVYRRIRDRQLQAIRLGRLWLVPREALEAVPAERMRPGAPRRGGIREAARRTAELLAGLEADVVEMFRSIELARSETDFGDPVQSP